MVRATSMATTTPSTSVIFHVDDDSGVACLSSTSGMNALSLPARHHISTHDALRQVLCTRVMSGECGLAARSDSPRAHPRSRSARKKNLSADERRWHSFPPINRKLERACLPELLSWRLSPC